MHTGQSSQVVLRFWVGSASDNSESLSEQANEDLGNFLDDLHSQPRYSDDWLEVPESSGRPAHNHVPEFDDDEMEADWYEWGLGTPHSSDSDFGDEVTQIPSDQYVSVEEVRNYDWDGFLRWRASRLRRATQRSARTVQAQTSSRSPANHHVPVTAGTYGITDEQGPKDKAVCATLTTDTCDSPRPLRDPCAPRPEGSSINGYYGNDAGKSSNTSTAASHASTESNAVASLTSEQRSRS